MAFFQWSIEMFGESFTINSGRISDIKITQSAKKKSSVCIITLSPYAKAFVEKLLNKAKLEQGIKLPKSLINTKEENASAVAASSAGGSLPGLEAIANKAEFSAFLDMISFAEGTYPDKYNLLVGGKTFSDYSRHPDVLVSGNFEQGSASSAAGRYQYLTTSWNEAMETANQNGAKVKDFSPESQNIATYWWIKRINIGAWNAIAANKPDQALRSLRYIWESFDRALGGRYDITEQQMLSLYATQRQKYLDYVAPKPAISLPESGASKPPLEAAEPSKEEISRKIVPVLDCNTRAFLDAVAWIIGTDLRGDIAYDTNIVLPGRTTLINNAEPLGRYRIQPAIWNNLGNGEIYDKIGQDRMMLKILHYYGGYDKLLAGDVAGASRELDDLIPEMPGGANTADSRSLTDLLNYHNGKKQACLSNEQLKIDPENKKVEEEEGGEIIKITVSSLTKSIEFLFYFENLDDFTVYGKSLDSKLDAQQLTENQYVGIKETELAVTLLRRNGFNLQVSSAILDSETTKNYILSDKTDRDTLEQIYKRTGIKYNPSGVLTADAVAVDALPVRRLIITDYFDVSVSNAAISPGDKVNFPVSLSLLTTTELLALAPGQKLSLLSPYNILPNALVFDEWILERITHSMISQKSELSLTKFIQSDEKEEGKSEGSVSLETTATGGEWAYPFNNPIVTSEFNPSRVNPVTGVIRPHKGTDLVPGNGSSTEPIKAVRAGKVVDIGYDSGGYGNFIVIRHDLEFETLYAHLSRVISKINDTVKQGQIIGNMGNTGIGTEAHLHLEILKAGTAVNSRLYLNYEKIA